MANWRDIGNDSFTLRRYKLASTVARYTPAPLAIGAAMALAAPFSIGMRDKRKLMERNLLRADPTLKGFALLQAVQRAFQSYARYYLESFRLSTISREAISADHSIEGFSHIENALQDGKGAILALPHVGGWEWAGRWLCDQGYALTAVVEKLEPPELYEWFLDIRTKMGVHVIPLDDRAGIAVQEALNLNRPVSLLCDRDIPRDGVRSGVEVEFFGESTTVPAGPAFFALRTGAPLIPAASYFTRRADGHHTVVCPPLVVERQGSLREDVARITQQLICEMEVLIKRAPEQWHLFQPNWPSDPGY
ncbi:MAG: phosphatidylinositol mannoside acyltransferase [Ilumatobacteraceae bacterium]